MNVNGIGVPSVDTLISLPLKRFRPSSSVCSSSRTERFLPCAASTRPQISAYIESATRSMAPFITGGDICVTPV